MTDKKFTVSPGGKVIIEINRRPPQRKQNFTGHQSPKGLMQTRRENEYLPRRLKKETGIEILDGGYWRDGDAWKDLSFFGDPVSQLNGQLATYIEWAKTGVGSIPQFPPQLAEASAATLNDYAELVAARSIDDFKKTSDQLTEFAADFADYLAGGSSYPMPFYAQVYSDSFSYALTDSLLPEDDPNFNQKWTKDGLKLTTSELSQPLFIDTEYRSNIQLSGDGHNKITTVADYDAPDAGFAPSGKMKIVIVPRPLAVQSLAIYQYDVLTSPKFGVNNSGLSLTHPQRARRWQKDDPNFIPASDARHYYARWKRGEVSATAEEYDIQYNRFVIVGANGSILEPSSAFPPPPADPYANPDEYPFLMLLGEDYAGEPEESFIIALIKKDDVLYYVWS